MNKLLAMQVFARVIETGTLSRAAAGLSMPKATATTLIQQLERALGTKLLDRTTRRVTPTPEGTAYYPHCVAILEEIREAEEALQQRRANPRGPLRVEVPTLIARMVIVPALPRFFAKYPDIELALGCSERHADLIEEGIDCGVWAGPVENPNLIARRVGQLLLGTCAAPPYLAVHGMPRHPDELAAHRCINHFSPRTGRMSHWVFVKDGTRIESRLKGHVALDDENSYVAAAEAGLGIAQIPAFVLKDSLERGTLELVLGDWLPEPAPLSVVYPQNRHLSGKIRVFGDWIAELFAEHDGIQVRSTLRGDPGPGGGV